MAAETVPAPVLQRCRTANCLNRQAGPLCPDHGGPELAKAEQAAIAETTSASDDGKDSKKAEARP